jgi:hypothetical protein
LREYLPLRASRYLSKIAKSSSLEYQENAVSQSAPVSGIRLSRTACGRLRYEKSPNQSTWTAWTKGRSGFVLNGAPGEIRTPDLLLRRQSLYPSELRARSFSLHGGVGKQQREPSLGLIVIRKRRRHNRTPVAKGVARPAARPNAKLLPTASSAAATAAATPVSAAISASASTVASAAAGVLRLGTRLVHVERATADLRAIQRSNSFFSILVAGHFHKAEPARPSGIAVGHDADPVHLSVRLKHLPQFFFRRVKAQISYKDVLH